MACHASASLITLLLATCLPHLSSASQPAPAQWIRQHWSCISESHAAATEEAVSERHCTTIAAAVKGDVIAQWNSVTKVCSAFHFQRVCRLATAPQPASNNNCIIYANAAFEAVRQSLSNKLVAVWHIISGIQFENLLCTASDPNTNRFYPNNGVTFSEDGVEFDGADAKYLFMNQSEFMRFNNGLTWMIRIRRKPLNNKVFMVSAECSNFGDTSMWWLEAPSATKLHSSGVKTKGAFGRLDTKSGTLPNDENQWMNLGFAASASSRDFFVGNSFLTASDYDKNNAYTRTAAADSHCFMIGGELHLPAKSIQGTVRAVGIANVSMTQQEIQQFFAALP